MNKFRIEFNCLQGEYSLEINFADFSYCVTSTIAQLESISSNINDEKFIEMFNKIDFEKWDRQYLDSSIEDGVKWGIYIDGKLVTEGIEANWPYQYDELIDSLILVDKNISFFKANLA